MPRMKSEYLERIKVQKSRTRRYAVRGTLLALLKTVLNFAPWHAYLWIALGLIVCCIVGKFTILAISRIIGYICAGLYEVARLINKITHNAVVNDIAKVGTTFICSLEHNKKCLRYVSNHTENIIPGIDLDQFRTLMQLSHGQCKDFETAWKVFKYILLLMVGGNNVCKNLEWFKTLTLTRIFIFYPASSVLWIDSKSNCDTTIATNVCAFAGMESVFDFVLTDCILPFVLIIGCWPLLKNAYRLLSCQILLIAYETQYLLYKLHPSKRCVSRSTFCSRRHQVVVVDRDDDDDKSGLSTR